ncbi:MAG: hypothetical protein HC831_09790 [Chloroflexia bacterium]|nr:hypothetical protein [Chloroflexia bacterium]
METNYSTTETFDETKSLAVIKEMIEVSQNKLKNDGILFIVWGWVMFYTYLTSFIQEHVITTYQIRMVIKYTGMLFGLFAVGFTIYYILKQRKKVQTYIGVSLRYVWISLFVCMVLVNLIQFNVLHEINFELQHPIFMVLIALATVVTGGILRYRLIIIGGIVFGLLAYASSYFPLEKQLFLEATAWLIAFIIPGHLMYLKRNK